MRSFYDIIPEKWFVLFWMCDFVSLTRCCKLVSSFYILLLVKLDHDSSLDALTSNYPCRYEPLAHIGYEPVGVFLPQGEFSTLFFSETPMSPEHFLLVLQSGDWGVWVIEVKGHQVHFWMWSISWSAINDYLVNLSQCVSPKWSQMV